MESTNPLSTDSQFLNTPAKHTFLCSSKKKIVCLFLLTGILLLVGFAFFLFLVKFGIYKSDWGTKKVATQNITSNPTLEKNNFSSFGKYFFVLPEGWLIKEELTCQVMAKFENVCSCSKEVEKQPQQCHETTVYNVKDQDFKIVISDVNNSWEMFGEHGGSITTYTEKIKLGQGSYQGEFNFVWDGDARYSDKNMNSSKKLIDKNGNPRFYWVFGCLAKGLCIAFDRDNNDKRTTVDSQMFKDFVNGLKITDETAKYDIDENLQGVKNPIDIGDLEASGSMTVPFDWQVKTTIYPGGSSSVRKTETKSIKIIKGEYAVEIGPFGTGRARCGTKADLKNRGVYFIDRDGYEYFRETYPPSGHGELWICSNGLIGKGKDDFGLETSYGLVSYINPNNPDNKILNIMDSILASFKRN